MIRNETLILFCLILGFYSLLPKEVDASSASPFHAPKGLRSLSKFLFDLKMRKSKKGQLKMKQSELSTQYINRTKPTDPPPKKNHCMEDSECPGNYSCIKPINQELKSRNLRPIPGFVHLKPILMTVHFIVV